MDAQGFADQYLGYSVLRPFPYRKIGRTVLKRVRNDRFSEFPSCEGACQIESKSDLPGPKALTRVWGENLLSDLAAFLTFMVVWPVSLLQLLVNLTDGPLFYTCRIAYLTTLTYADRIGTHTK